MAEDDRGMRSLLTRALRRDGFETLVVATGTDALEALASEDVDLVISDYQLPGATGGAVGAMAARRGIPAVLVTGTPEMVSPEELEHFLMMLPKPFSLVELAEAFEALRSAVGRRRSRSGVRARERSSAGVIAAPAPVAKTGDGER
ncbi:MAG: response regulator [Myxococcota bacterium]